jgi:hypothetical protein
MAVGNTRVASSPAWEQPQQRTNHHHVADSIPGTHNRSPHDPDRPRSCVAGGQRRRNPSQSRPTLHRQRLRHPRPPAFAAKACHPPQSSTSPSPRAKRRQKKATLLPCAFGGRAPPPPPAAAARGARDPGCLAVGRGALQNRPRERSGRGAGFNRPQKRLYEYYFPMAESRTLIT